MKFDYDDVQNYFLRRISGNHVSSRHRARKFHPERFSKAIWRSLEIVSYTIAIEKEKKKKQACLLECSFLRASFDLGMQHFVSLLLTPSLLVEKEIAARRLPLRFVANSSWNRRFLHRIDRSIGRWFNPLAINGTFRSTAEFHREFLSIFCAILFAKCKLWKWNLDRKLVSFVAEGSVLSSTHSVFKITQKYTVT